MQRELELIKEPSSGQVIKRSSFFGFNLDSNLDLVRFESSYWILWSWNIYEIRGDFVHILHHHFRGGGGSRAMMILMTQGGVGGPKLAKSWWCNICTLPNIWALIHVPPCFHWEHHYNTKSNMLSRSRMEISIIQLTSAQLSKGLTKHNKIQQITETKGNRFAHNTLQTGWMTFFVLM